MALLSKGTFPKLENSPPHTHVEVVPNILGSRIYVHWLILPSPQTISPYRTLLPEQKDKNTGLNEYL